MRSDSVPTVSFRHDTDDALLRDPHGTWDRLRDQYREFRSLEADHGLWFLLGYEDAHAALRDPQTFSSDIISPGFRAPDGNEQGAGYEGLKLIPEQLDRLSTPNTASCSTRC